MDKRHIIVHKKRDKCRGKWKQHGELKTIVSVNNNVTHKVTQKICTRCNAYVYWEYEDL